MIESKVTKTASASGTTNRMPGKMEVTTRTPGKMDVTKRAEVKLAIDKAIAEYGQIDVLVNNAGYGIVGALEETPEEEFRNQMETNF